MSKKHEPKKLAQGVSLPERIAFVKLCQQCALPWQMQAGLVNSITSGNIKSLDQMVSFIEKMLSKKSAQHQSKKDHNQDQRVALWKVWSLPELEKLTVPQWDLYVQCLSLCSGYSFWSTGTLTEVSEWQQAWYRFCGVPTLSLPSSG